MERQPKFKAAFFERFFDVPVLISGLLGFTSGFSLLLILSTTPYWLSCYGVCLWDIGTFALVASPYALKFLWAPLVDFIKIPLLDRLMGHRRSWTFITHTILFIGVLMLSQIDPSKDYAMAMAITAFVTFSSATRDIITDAYRVETVSKEQMSAASTEYVFGYRIGMLVSSAGAIYCSAKMSWENVFIVMSGFVLVGIITAIIMPEPKRKRAPADSLDKEVYAKNFHEYVVSPLKEFSSRPGWIGVLFFVLFYKLGDNYVHGMANLFFKAKGFSPEEIATVAKTFGLFTSIVGGFIGGFLVSRIGILNALLYCGIPHMLVHTLYPLLSIQGYNLPLLYITIALGSITGGMCTAAFVAFLTRMCNRDYSATQYAIFSSLWSLSNILSNTTGGWLTHHIGWTSYFSFAVLMSFPGILLIFWLRRNAQLLLDLQPQCDGSYVGAMKGSSK